MALQRQQAEHGGETGRADGHGVLRIQSGRQADQPVTLDGRALRETAPVAFTDTEAGEDHAVTRFPARVAALFDDTREIDARNHGPLAHDGTAAGDGKRILVVQAGPLNLDAHIRIRQGGIIEIGQPGNCLAVFALLQQYGLEHISFSPVIHGTARRGYFSN
jgi:hypothetical protein